MDQINEAINQAVSSLKLDNLKVDKEQLKIIKDNIMNGNDDKVIDDLIKEADKKVKINER